MANVQQQLEEMTEDLRNMLSTKLYTQEETREILKKRTHFKHKINGLNKNLQDFRNYISYEQTLLRDVGLRRKKNKFGEEKIERNIIKRIRELYRTAMEYFPNSMLLVLHYFKFCKQVNYVHTATEMVSKMIQLFPTEENVWIVATGWYAYDCKDLPKAREMLLKGLAMHKSFKELYKEGIEMELFYATGKHIPGRQTLPKQERDKNDKDEAQKKLAVEKINAYLNEAFQNVDVCDFYFDILEILEKHTFTNKSQQSVIEHILSKYSNNELLWHKLAQREAKGLHYPVDGSESQSQANPTKKHLMDAISKYQDGIKKVSPDKKEKMWALFLDFLLELQYDIFGVAKVFKLDSLKQAFMQACSEGYLTEKYFLHWLEHTTNEEEALHIAEKGSEAVPQSILLWKARLQYLIMKENDEEILMTFKKGREALKEKSLPLWNALIRYHMLRLENDEIEVVFKSGLKEPPPIGDSLKSQYLEWLAITKSISDAKTAYFSIVHEKPYSKELHLTMIKVSMMELDMDSSALERVHKLAIEQFGKEDVDVWINYCHFYFDYYKTPDEIISKKDISKRLMEIYNDAMKDLPPSLQDEFLERFKSIEQNVSIELQLMDSL